MLRPLIVCSLALCLFSCASLQARDPNNKDSETQQPTQTAVPPTSPPAARSNVTGPPGSEETNQHQDEPRWLGFPIGSWADWVMVFITFAGIRYARRTLRKLKSQTRAAVDNAKAAKASAEGLKNAERAYVAITHQQADDRWHAAGEELPIGFHKHGNRQGELHPHLLETRIFNSGHTPAEVYGGLITRVIALDANPYKPPTDINAMHTAEGWIPPYYLAAGKYYRKKIELLLTLDEMQAISGHNGQLWLVGFVIYQDVFGALHRAGFCRRVKTETVYKNNLFVDVTCMRYNYDHEINEDGTRKEQLNRQGPARKPSVMRRLERATFG